MHWLLKERRGERAFNLDPNRPLHLSTTQGVNQHLSNKSGDKGGEEKKGEWAMVHRRGSEKQTEKGWIRGMEKDRRIAKYNNRQADGHIVYFQIIAVIMGSCIPQFPCLSYVQVFFQSLMDSGKLPFLPLQSSSSFPAHFPSTGPSFQSFLHWA